jgi:hypothetical protein
VVAVGDDIDLAFGGALHVLGELEQTAVSQGQPSTQVTIGQCGSFADDLETGYTGSVSRRSLTESRYSAMVTSFVHS